jgi:hypothetical protein
MERSITSVGSKLWEALGYPKKYSINITELHDEVIISVWLKKRCKRFRGANTISMLQSIKESYGLI